MSGSPMDMSLCLLRFGAGNMSYLIGKDQCLGSCGANLSGFGVSSLLGGMSILSYMQLQANTPILKLFQFLKS